MGSTSPLTQVVIEQVHPTLRIDEVLLETVIRQVISEEKVPVSSVTIVLTDRSTVLDLNRTYLNHDYPTDVLSFNLSDEDPSCPVEGEVYVDLDMAADRHAEFNSGFQNETFRYVVHGLLHLIGYDDATSADKLIMHEREDSYLKNVPLHI